MAETFEHVSDKNSFEAIVAHCDDAIIGISLTGSVICWNSGATKLFSLSADEMIGQHISRIIPAEARRASKLDVSSAQQQDEVRKVNVLLVEDDHLILMAASDMVSGFGHTVFEAGTAAAELAILEDNPIDVMIRDIGLPGMSGTSLAQQVEKRWPAIWVIIASGVSAPDLKDGAQLGAQVKWLGKPYDAEDLREAWSEGRDAACRIASYPFNASGGC